MDSENWETNYRGMGLELPRKRKSKKRGKQSRKNREAGNESSDSNVLETETDAYNNEDAEENTISLMNNCKLGEDQGQITNDNENINHSRITIDTIVTQSSVENDTEQYPITEYNNDGPSQTENLVFSNLISDNNKSIFTDGTPKSSSYVNSSGQSLNVANKNAYEELRSEDIKTMYPTSPTLVPEEQELYNSKALPKTAPTYELEKFGKNVLIIFNHKNFYGPETRQGTEQDVIALTKTFEAFDFDVLPYTDRTKDQIMEILSYVSSQDFTDYGCVGVVVLTHGSNNGQLYAKDDMYTEMDIINSLKTHRNPSMITKPRLIIIQACRGKKAIAGMAVLRRDRIRTDHDYETEPYTLPVEADMLVLHSSYAGNPAHRHEIEGTWFIQTLCKKINEMASTHDLESILTEVKREVAVDKEHMVTNRNTGGIDVNKQMPVVTSTLIRKLYLRKYGECADNTASNMSQTCNDVAVDSHTEPSMDKCLCTLQYFTYIKTCLRYYVEDNPDDAGARTLLDLAETFNNTSVFDPSKEKCALTISHLLKQKAKNTEYYKYLHFYIR